MKDPAAAPENHVQDRSGRFAVAALAITWMLAAWRVSPSTAWSGDYATIQVLSGSAADPDGVVSAVVCRLLLLIPVGTAIQRLGMASALGAAWAAYFAYQLAYQSLDRHRPEARSRCWLALGASLLASLGPVAQAAATRPNSPTVALALGLASTWLIVRWGARDHSRSLQGLEPRQVARAFLLGGVVAFTCLESLVVGLFTAVFGIALFAWYRSSLSRPARLGLVVGFGAPYLAVGLPWWLARRGLAAASTEHQLLSSLGTLRPFSGTVAKLDWWVTLVGPIWFALAIVGLGLLLLSRERRRAAWHFMALASALVLMPANAANLSNRGDAVALVGAALLAIAATNGLKDLAHWATLRRPSALALATTLAVLGQAVTILARSEEAAFALAQHQDLGAEAWTDEALAALPARAVVLARTGAIIERLHAAQLAEGMRPDVLVVPLERATKPHIVDLLVSAEPQLIPLLRDLAINGRPSENSMSGLADARPLFVEFDGSWDPRLREHLLALPFFHRVLSQTLGRSDRAAAIPDGQRAVQRLLGVLDASRPGGNAAAGWQRTGSALTRSIIELRLREQLTLLLALGDRQSFESLASEYAKAFTNSQWLERLRQRLGSTNRNAVDAFDLLEEGAGAVRGTSAPSPTRTQG